MKHDKTSKLLITISSDLRRILDNEKLSRHERKSLNKTLNSFIQVRKFLILKDIDDTINKTKGINNG